MKLLRSILSGAALAFIAVSFFCITAADAKSVSVHGYTRKDGTYVAPYVRTSPNNTKSDNYSTKGNINPYTGKEGTKPGDAATATVPAAQTQGEDGPVVITLPPVESPKPVRVIVVLKPGTMKDLKGGMTQRELTDVLGFPKEVEGKGTYEIWTYPIGKVYFSPKAGVMAWREKK